MPLILLNFSVEQRFKNYQFAGDGEEFCVLCAIREQIELSLATLGGMISPLKIVNNLSCILLCTFRFMFVTVFSCCVVVFKEC